MQNSESTADTDDYLWLCILSHLQGLGNICLVKDFEKQKPDYIICSSTNTNENKSRQIDLDDVSPFIWWASAFLLREGNPAIQENWWSPLGEYWNREMFQKTMIWYICSFWQIIFQANISWHCLKSICYSNSKNLFNFIIEIYV